MSLYTQFHKEIKGKIQKSLEKKNVHETPIIDKVIVSVGIGSLVTRKGVKDFSDVEKNLMKITGQKPMLLKAKKAISNFKLREGMPVMYKVTLRRERAYDFLDKLTKVVLPRVRDFNGLNPKSFDPQHNINIGLSTQAIFPEMLADEPGANNGIQITIVTHAKTRADAQTLLESLGFIFITK